MSSIQAPPETEARVRAPDLSALVAARICHDLGNPIGAIGNGVELLALGGDLGGAEMALISQSVEAAQARLRFSRVAFGEASPGQEVSGAEARAILAARGAQARWRYNWDGPATLPRTDLRALFLAILCLEAALPAGGCIALRPQGQDWRLDATGPRLADDGPQFDALRGGAAPPPTAGAVHFALLPQILSGMGRRLRLLQEGETLVLAF